MKRYWLQRMKIRLWSQFLLYIMATFFFKTSTWYCLIFILGFNRSFHLFICINEAEILIWFICISHGLFLVYEIIVKWMTTSCPTIALASGNLVLVLPSFTEFFLLLLLFGGWVFTWHFGRRTGTVRNDANLCKRHLCKWGARPPFSSLSLSLSFSHVCVLGPSEKTIISSGQLSWPKRERERENATN